MLMNTGHQLAGRPSMGSWVTYGLGTENQNLPGFVVLPDIAFPQGGTENWSNGFLPPFYQGTPLRAQGSPILDMNPPAGVTKVANVPISTCWASSTAWRWSSIRGKKIWRRA